MRLAGGQAIGVRIDIVEAIHSTIIIAKGLTPIVFAMAMTIGISRVTVTTLDINWVITIVSKKITIVIKYTLVEPPIILMSKSAICLAAPVLFRAVAKGVIPPNRITVLMLTNW